MKAKKSSSLDKRNNHHNTAMREALIPLRDLLKKAAKDEAETIRKEPNGRSLYKFLFEGILPVVRAAGNESTVMYLHTGDEAIVYVFRPSYISEKNGLSNLKLQMRIFLQAITKIPEGGIAYFGLAPAQAFAFNTRRNFEYDHALEYITEKGQFVKLKRTGTINTYDYKGNPIEAAFIEDELIQRGEVPTDELRAVHKASIERDKRKAEEKRLRKEKLAQEEAIRKAAKAIPVTEEDTTAMNSEVIQNAKKKKKKKKAKQNGTTAEPASVEAVVTTDVLDPVTTIGEVVIERVVIEPITETTPVVEDTVAAVEASAPEAPVEPVTEMPAVEKVAPVYETLENALVSANVVDPAEAPATESTAETPAEVPVESVDTAVAEEVSPVAAVETAGEVASHE